MRELKIDIRGMSCDHCVSRVARTLQAAGVTVKSVEVGSAEVEYDPAAISLDAIIRKVTDAGYPAQAAARTA